MKRFGLRSGMSGFRIFAIGADALTIVIRSVICGSRVKVLSKNPLNSLDHGFGQHRWGHPKAM